MTALVRGARKVVLFQFAGGYPGTLVCQKILYAEALLTVVHIKFKLVESVHSADTKAGGTSAVYMPAAGE